MTEQAHDQHDVFISFSRTDQKWVRDELLPRLEEAGLKIIVGYRDFELGVPKLINIERAVDNSRHTLVVMTPAWINSEWDEFASLLASTKDPAGRTRKLLPLMLSPCEPPGRIALLMYADFTDPATRNEEMAHLLHNLGVQKARIFISYKHGVDPDENVARIIHKALSQWHEVFIDEEMAVGTYWPEHIENKVRQSDFLITLLSTHSVNSEMVEAEIALAHKIAPVQDGHPAILPVRLDYREAFRYPLSAYLDHIQWAFWSSHTDTPRLISQLMRAIAGGELPIRSTRSKKSLLRTKKSIAPVQSLLMPLAPPLPVAQPPSLEAPGGTMDPQSRFYVERTSDSRTNKAIKYPHGWTITIKGARQMGKSSLLLRTMASMLELGKQVAFLDFHLFDKDVLSNKKTFYRQFCLRISKNLGLEDRISAYWSEEQSENMSCTDYMSDYILNRLDKPLVLAMDEVDSLLETDFSSDFFSMLRAWCNARSGNPIWKRLDLVLVTSTDPYLLINNPNQSPFNVGQDIELSDFTPEQVADLNDRHGKPLTSEGVEQLLDLIGGHPYLVRKALYWIASQSSPTAEFFSNAATDAGPFGDHLRYLLFRLDQRKELGRGLLQSIQEHKCSDRTARLRLEAAGLVRREKGVVLPRCRLYAEYFQEHLRD